MEVHDKEDPVTIREVKGEVLCRNEIDVPTRMTVREEIRNWISSGLLKRFMEGMKRIQRFFDTRMDNKLKRNKSCEDQ